MAIELVPLNSIFEILHGNKLDLNKMSQCAPSADAIAFIGRSDERNGFTAFVERLDLVKPYDSGLITVALGGSALASFVQPREFYTAQNIDVLRPRSPMSLDTKLYYCLCITANRFRYSTFGREANRTLKTLEIPALRCVPSWVHGAAKTSVAAFASELMGLIEAEETATMAPVWRSGSHSHIKASRQTQGTVAASVTTEIEEEDVRDAEIARATLSKLNADQNSLVSGSDLDETLTELLS
jgi:hypothetical protein